MSPTPRWASILSLLALQAGLLGACSQHSDRTSEDTSKNYETVDRIVDGKAISNPKLLAQLVKSGVDLNQARMIDHTLYANNETEMNGAATELKQQGFKVETGANTDGTYWIDASIMQTPNQAASVEFIKKLAALCVKYHCAYDGWGTEVSRGSR